MMTQIIFPPSDLSQDASQWMIGKIHIKNGISYFWLSKNYYYSIAASSYKNIALGNIYENF